MWLRLCTDWEKKIAVWSIHTNWMKTRDCWSKTQQSIQRQLFDSSEYFKDLEPHEIILKKDLKYEVTEAMWLKFTHDPPSVYVRKSHSTIQPWESRKQAHCIVKNNSRVSLVLFPFHLFYTSFRSYKFSASSENWERMVSWRCVTIPQEFREFYNKLTSVW
jgi:hypothetical protein